MKIGNKREQYSVYLKFGKTEFESGSERHMYPSLDLELGAVPVNFPHQRWLWEGAGSLLD